MYRFHWYHRRKKGAGKESRPHVHVVHIAIDCDWEERGNATKSSIWQEELIDRIDPP